MQAKEKYGVHSLRQSTHKTKKELWSLLRPNMHFFSLVLPFDALRHVLFVTGWFFLYEEARNTNGEMDTFGHGTRKLAGYLERAIEERASTAE
jgi:hypothetical protein